MLFLSVIKFSVLYDTCGEMSNIQIQTKEILFFAKINSCNYLLVT